MGRELVISKIGFAFNIINFSFSKKLFLEARMISSHQILKEVEDFLDRLRLLGPKFELEIL